VIRFDVYACLRRFVPGAGLALAACGTGTVIVDYSVDAQVAIHDESGRAVDGGVVQRLPSPTHGFPVANFRGKDFEWSFGTGTLGIGGTISNATAEPLCMRFDEAKVHSNLHPTPIALSVYNFTVWRPRWEMIGSNDPRTMRLFTPPKFCLKPLENLHISMAPELAPLFPTARMFNVSWVDNQPQLVETGVGNWIGMSLPIEIGARREVMDIKLTATDSRARISNY